VSDDKSATKLLEGPEGKKKGKRKLILIGAAAAVALAGGGSAYALMGGKSDGHAAEAEAEAPAEASGGEGGHGEEGAEKFVDVPAMVVNLRNADGGSHFIKLHFMLVPGAKVTPDALKGKLPLLLDSYQPFLRELRPEDLAGSAAVFRIKEELLVRADDTLGAGQVKDVLIQDLVQQ
jgi:flagellar FliL protein